MAESGMDLYNLAKAQLADNNANNPFYALSEGVQKGVDQSTAEIQQRRQLELVAQEKLKAQQAQLEQFQRQTDLINASQETTKPVINTVLGKATTNAENPTYADTKVINPKGTMSLVNGGVGDTQGNPINTPAMSLPNGNTQGQQIQAPQSPSLQDTFASAQAQLPPQLPNQAQAPTQTGVTDYPKAQLDLKTASDGTMIPSISMNTDKINAFNKDAYDAGVDPSGKTRTQIMSEIAIQKNKMNNPYYQMQRQDQLTKQAETYITKQISMRSGGLGQQDAKVNAAIHARQLIDQAYDPKTGNYKVSQVPYGELSESVGSLLSGGTGTSEGRISALKQKTAQGDINGVLTYFTGRPSNATSQEAIKQLVGIIDRQGSLSEDLRDHYVNGIKQLPVFKELDPAVADNLMRTNLGNSFKEYLSKSPDQGSQQNSRPTAVNPKTGQKLQLSEDGKSWVPVQ